MEHDGDADGMSSLTPFQLHMKQKEIAAARQQQQQQRGNHSRSTYYPLHQQKKRKYHNTMLVQQRGRLDCRHNSSSNSTKTTATTTIRSRHGDGQRRGGGGGGGGGGYLGLGTTTVPPPPPATTATTTIRSRHGDGQRRGEGGGGYLGLGTTTVPPPPPFSFPSSQCRDGAPLHHGGTTTNTGGYANQQQRQAVYDGYYYYPQNTPVASSHYGRTAPPTFGEFPYSRHHHHHHHHASPLSSSTSSSSYTTPYPSTIGPVSSLSHLEYTHSTAVYGGANRYAPHSSYPPPQGYPPHHHLHRVSSHSYHHRRPRHNSPSVPTLSYPGSAVRNYQAPPSTSFPPPRSSFPMVVATIPGRTSSVGRGESSAAAVAAAVVPTGGSRASSSSSSRTSDPRRADPEHSGTASMSSSISTSPPSAIVKTTDAPMPTADTSFTCEPCNREFSSLSALKTHIEKHVPCPHTSEGCTFEAVAKVVREHDRVIHKKVPPKLPKSLREIIPKKYLHAHRQIVTPEAVDSWIEARRSNYPTKDNLQRKRARLEEERNSRAEGGGVAMREETCANKKEREPSNTVTPGSATNTHDDVASTSAAKRKQQICRHFAANGRCRFGTSCRNIHDDPENVDCRFFLKGHCGHGASCQYRHDRTIARIRQKTAEIQRAERETRRAGVGAAPPSITSTMLAGRGDGGLLSKLFKRELECELSLIEQVARYVVKNGYFDSQEESTDAHGG